MARPSGGVETFPARFRTSQTSISSSVVLPARGVGSKPFGSKLSNVAIDWRGGPVFLKHILAKMIVVAEGNDLVRPPPCLLRGEGEAADAAEKIEMPHEGSV